MTFETARCAVQECDWRIFFDSINASHMNSLIKDGIRMGIRLVSEEPDEERDLQEELTLLGIRKEKFRVICERYNWPLEETIRVHANGRYKDIQAFENKIVRRIKLRPEMLSDLHSFSLEESESEVTGIRWSFISSSFFLDEVLENVVIIDDLAWGDRIDEENYSTPLQFKLRKDGWRININCAGERPSKFNAT